MIQKKEIDIRKYDFTNKFKDKIHVIDSQNDSHRIFKKFLDAAYRKKLN